MVLLDEYLPMNQMALEPQQKVFLSHSGAQKGFVEQLNLDLKQRDRHAFLDKDRECIPIGENFPHRILNAIQHCEVGVVVLSDEFLSTKWPMLELVEMVRRMGSEGDRMILMPIFYGVSVEDLKDEENRRKWKADWEKIAKNDIRIDISEWEHALKMLNPINGLVYNSKNGEVKFREEIVQAMCAKVLPDLPWDDAHVEAKSHFIEIIKSKRTLVATTNVLRVGLYGVGGIGKTTACKVLCNHFEMEFYGKVCHVEVGKATKMENLHMILKKFTKAQHEHLEELSFDQCRTRLKNIKERVFLAIDNLSSDFDVIEEVRTYLGVEFEPGSILVITARTLNQLKKVMDGNDCLPMPEIDEVGAKNLFCLHAEVKSDIKNEILETCINRCKFGKGDGSSHYLPLVLEVLGKHLRGSDPCTWVMKLQNHSDILNESRERKHPVFGTFGISYDALRAEDKDLFLDVAIFHSEPLYTWENIVYDNYGLGSPLHWNVYEWLRMLHELRDIGEVKLRLNTLKTKSLLEEVDYYRRIGMHDLWKEFALHEIKAKEKECQRWVCERNIVKRTQVNSSDEVELEESILIDGGWDKLERISILRVGKENNVDLSISSCPNLKALRLIGVRMQEGEVNLIGLKKLRIMEVYDSTIQISSEMGQLRNLRVLIWTSMDMKSVQILEQIGSLKNLRILTLHFAKLEYLRYWRSDEGCVEESSALVPLPPTILSLDLTHLSSLQVVEIINGGFTTLSLSSKLRLLDLSNSFELVNCPGLESMSGLEVLKLSKCSKLETLPNLQKFINLKVLDISENKLLTKVPGLEDMVALQRLCAFGCSRLQTLPDMSKLTKLQELNVEGCDMLECIPGMSNLIALSKLHVMLNFLRITPNSGNLMNLDKVHIIGRTTKDRYQESSSEEEESNTEEEDWRTAEEESNTEEEDWSTEEEDYSTEEEYFTTEEEDWSKVIVLSEVCSNLIPLSGVYVMPNSFGDTPNSGNLMNLDEVHSSRRTKNLHPVSSTKEEDCSTEEEDDMMEVDMSLNAESSQAVDMLSNQEMGFSHGDNDTGSSRMDEGSNHGDGDHDFVLNKGVDVCSSTQSQRALDLSTIEHVSSSLTLHAIDCELKNVHKLTRLETLYLTNSHIKKLPDMGDQMRLKSLTIRSCWNLRSWDGVGKLELMEPNTNLKLQCNWTLVHLVKLDLFCYPIQLPDLSHFPQLTDLHLSNREPYHRRPALHCQNDHVKLKKLRIEAWPIIELPDLSKFSSLETLIVIDCRDLRTLTASKPLTTLERLVMWWCKDLKVLPSISNMKVLREFTLYQCGVTLNRHECQELSPSCKCLIVR